MGVIANVKSILITLNMFLDISLNQYIVIVDLPSLFGIYLSKELIAKLGGYLHLDCIHLLIPQKEKYVKILNEGTKSIHLRNLIAKFYECSKIG